MEQLRNEKNDKENRKLKYIELKKLLSENKKISMKDKIFMRVFELEKLKIEEKELEKKNRLKRIKNINKVINLEIEKEFSESGDETLDIKIASLFLYALDNSEELYSKIDFSKYVEYSKRGVMNRKVLEQKNTAQISEDKDNEYNSHS
ncbi:hypothetical protein H3N56_11335 [Cetobacterium sp. 2A]|uniref:hypothetical protein n=1 Tax=Cetobacterium sp. 2A TaxID=2754723 RepID=UPI00163BC890|nr:hypothetical protein [Cetobacterium sp. 2A]MBC2857025.1 hypothetical protein [Cetobacterium sp. 2A]